MPRPEVRLQQVVLGASPVLDDPLQVALQLADEPGAARGQLLLREQARLDPLGQLHLLLGGQQPHLADLLEIVLDRVGGGTGHRDLRGRKIFVIIAEDEDLLILPRTIRGQPDHPGVGHARRPGRSVRHRGRLVRVRLFGVFGSFRYFRTVDVAAGQIVGIAGHFAGIAEVGLVQVLLGHHGLKVGVVGVQIAKVVQIRVLQIRVSIEIRLVEVHRDQAAVGIGTQPRIVFIRVPWTRTVWLRSRHNRWVRVSAAVALCLAGPAVSLAGVLTTGLSGTAAAVRFPPASG
jgi:hypothetical protein